MERKNKENLLTDLASINYIQGRHSGIWDTVNDRISFAEECLEEMMGYARTYEIPFENELKDNFSKEEWEEHKKFGEEYAIDDLLFRLKEEIEKKIKEKLLQ